MAKEKIIKTNAIRMLDKAKVPYIHRCWEQATGQHTGVELAQALGQDPAQVFKTLVTVAKSGEHYVFLVPVAEELDLKKAAAAVGEKAISMCKSKDLLPLTGYIHGGCSPIGMKKHFPTYIEEMAQLYDTIMVSAGQRGVQVTLSPEDLRSYVQGQFVSLV